MSKKDVRENFRNSVFKRDNYKCVLCKRTDLKLDAHHITNRNKFLNGGYVKSNGITLCDNGEEGCHYKVEKYYNSENRDAQNPYHPESLYKLINSSFSKALKDDSTL